eukprot:ANDGO_06951.mRNA.1 Ras-related protein Rab-32B
MSSVLGPPVSDSERTFKILCVGDYATGKTSLIQRLCTGFFTPNYKVTIGVDFGKRSYPGRWVDSSFASDSVSVSEGQAADSNRQQHQHNESESNADRSVSVDDELSGKHFVEGYNVQLWDVAGHERFGTMLGVYYRQAAGAVIVCDVSRPQTSVSVTKWVRDMDEKVRLPNGDKIPKILIVNKCDMLEERDKSAALSGSGGGAEESGEGTPKAHSGPAKQFVEPSAADALCQELDLLGWFYTSSKTGVNVEDAFMSIGDAVSTRGECSLQQINSKKNFAHSTVSLSRPTSPKTPHSPSQNNRNPGIGDLGAAGSTKKKGGCC